MGIINSIKNHIPFFSNKSEKVISKEEMEQNTKDTIQLAEQGKRAMDNKIFSYDMVSAGKKYIKAIKRKSYNEKARIIAKAALKVGSGSPDPRSEAFEAAFNVIKAGVPMPIGAALSTVASRSTRWVPFSYDQVSRTKHFMKEIIKNSKDQNEVELAKAALSVKSSGTHDPRAEAFEVVFDKIRVGATGPVSTVLAEAGIDGMQNCLLYDESAAIGKAFLKAIVKNTGETSPVGKIAKEALDQEVTGARAENTYAKALLKIKGPKAAQEAQKKVKESGKDNFILNEFNKAREGKTQSDKPKKEYILVDDEVVVIGGVKLKKGRKS